VHGDSAVRRFRIDKALLLLSYAFA
jgi:hypothetical protein